MTVIRRITIITLISLCALVLLYFAAVLAGGLITSGGGSESDSANPVDPADCLIILQNNGRHFDIWLPAEFCEPLAGERSGWLSFGWGDRDFYLRTPYAGDLAPGLLFKTLFIPTQTVIAVDYSEKEPSAGDLTRLRVSRDQLTAAWAFIDGYLGTYSEIPGELVHPSYGELEFYEAGGRYSLLYTCNNWTGDLLKDAGLTSGVWTPLTFGVGRNQD